MKTKKTTEALSKIAFISTMIFWAILILGFVYASFFVSNETPPKSIMSPKTVTQLYVISLSWVITPFLEIISITALLIGGKNKKVITALVLNAIPITFLVLVFVIQKGNFIYGCKEILHFALSPIRW